MLGKVVQYFYMNKTTNNARTNPSNQEVKVLCRAGAMPYSCVTMAAYICTIVVEMRLILTYIHLLVGSKPRSAIRFRSI